MRKIIVVLTGSDELNVSIGRYLKFVIGINNILYARLGNPSSLISEMFQANLWIAEVFNPEDIENPEGFRTAKKFAGKTRFLLLFVGGVPEKFPREGSFWLTLPCYVTLYEKMKRVLSGHCPTIDDYQYLEKLWPLLEEGPSHHHHGRSG